MIRVGQVIGIKNDRLSEYTALHKNVPPEVAEKISDCNIRNYSIFHRGGTLFSYFEYTGDDFDADMKKMAAHEATRKWWDVVGPMQIPMTDRKDGEWWASTTEVFHQD